MPSIHLGLVILAACQIKTGIYIFAYGRMNKIF